MLDSRLKNSNLELCYSKCGLQTGSVSIPKEHRRIKNLRWLPQDLHFNQMPRHSLCRSSQSL